MHCTAIPVTEYLPRSGTLVLATFRTGPDRPMRWDNDECCWRHPDGTEYDGNSWGSVTHWESLTDEQLRAVLAEGGGQ